jgi:SAM-dependent methyltransferase
MPDNGGTHSTPAVRHQYQRHGVRGFYTRHGPEYRNPHEPQIRRSLEKAVREWPFDLSHVLDLAAGSGEVTLALRELRAGQIDGIDPFTFDAYEARTGQRASRETFEDIAAWALAERRWSLIVCSFALHLVEPSRLPAVAYQLSIVAPRLLVLTPHKRPILRGEWGWELTQEMLVQRVRSSLYCSNRFVA